MTGLTPLHYASKEGHKAAIEALIAVGSDVHAKYSVRWAECDTLFERSGNILELMFLRKIFQFTYPHIPYQTGGTAIHWAAFCGNKDCMLALVSHGADIHAKDKVGRAD